MGNSRKCQFEKNFQIDGILLKLCVCKLTVILLECSFQQFRITPVLEFIGWREGLVDVCGSCQQRGWRGAA